MSNFLNTKKEIALPGRSLKTSTAIALLSLGTLVATTNISFASDADDGRDAGSSAAGAAPRPSAVALGKAAATNAEETASGNTAPATGSIEAQVLLAVQLDSAQAHLGSVNSADRKAVDEAEQLVMSLQRKVTDVITPPPSPAQKQATAAVANLVAATPPATPARGQDSITFSGLTPRATPVSARPKVEYKDVKEAVKTVKADKTKVGEVKIITNYLRQLNADILRLQSQLATEEKKVGGLVAEQAREKADILRHEDLKASIVALDEILKKQASALELGISEVTRPTGESAISQDEEKALLKKISDLTEEGISTKKQREELITSNRTLKNELTEVRAENIALKAATAHQPASPAGSANGEGSPLLGGKNAAPTKEKAACCTIS